MVPTGGMHACAREAVHALDIGQLGRVELAGAADDDIGAVDPDLPVGDGRHLPLARFLVIDHRSDEGIEDDAVAHAIVMRSEEHTSELQSLMRISYAVFCLK